MKKFTAKEIAEYLANSGTEFEWEGDEAHHYLHYKDGQLVSSNTHADFNTYVRDDYLEDLWARLLEEAREECAEKYKEEYVEEYAEEKALERFDQIAWTTETADSPQLLAVAQELADDLNAYIEEQELSETQPSLWDLLIEEEARELAEERRESNGEGNA